MVSGFLKDRATRWVFLILGAVALLPHLAPPAKAQQFGGQAGLASQVDLIAAARALNMQNTYTRALFQHIRNNPAILDNQQFYVGFVSYLLYSRLVPDGRNYRECQDAFANEFERRDFFTQSFTHKEGLAQIVASARIPERFDVSYIVNTGNYDFATQSLPFQGIRTLGEGLGYAVQDGMAQTCASQILTGIDIDLSAFPWSFQIVNAAGKSDPTAFPFGNALTLPASDARLLFETFGRQLYALVSYQFQTAHDGSHRVQLIPAQGQLFGLSSNSVVRAATLNIPNFAPVPDLDITNPLNILIDLIGLDADLQFQQEGFRAVGKGTRQDPGTGLTQGGTFQISGSGAVGSSTFILRLAVPQLITKMPGLPNEPGAQRYLTLFGNVDANKATATLAPVSGVAIVLQIGADGQLREAQPMAFSGAFRRAEAKQETAQAPKTGARTLLDDGTPTKAQ